MLVPIRRHNIKKLFDISDLVCKLQTKFPIFGIATSRYATLKENFRNFFFGHFAGINSRELDFTEDFVGINFRELSEGFRGKSPSSKIFAGVNLTFALRNIFPRP